MTLVVQPADLADYLGIASPTSDQLAAFGRSLADAQADVTGYLGWPIPPATKTEHNLWPAADGWRLEIDPGHVVEVVSADAELDTDNVPTGYWTVTYRYGLDVTNDPGSELYPIWRFILRHAAASPEVARVWRAATGATSGVKSVSTDGQSITYDAVAVPGGGGGAAGSGALGAPPVLGSLSRWKKRSVYQRRVTVPTEIGYFGGWR
jgi:hypothetical protein